MNSISKTPFSNFYDFSLYFLFSPKVSYNEYALVLYQKAILLVLNSS